MLSSYRLKVNYEKNGSFLRLFCDYHYSLQSPEYHHLAYDIVKAHGGEIKVETKEARPPARAGTDGDDPVGREDGSVFNIQIPVN